jgi:peptidoglycan LD-endopeptidase LytH
MRARWTLALMFLELAVCLSRALTQQTEYGASPDQARRAPSEPAIESPIRGGKVSQLRDSFDEVHNGHRHEAIDIDEPQGTPVHAVVDGTIQKLFFSKAGGITIYEFDEKSVYCYYYAHLERYADGVHEGMHTHQGEVIGYVGSTGDASPAAPHLHFTINLLGSQKQWWKGTPINPYSVLVRSLSTAAGTSSKEISIPR